MATARLAVDIGGTFTDLALEDGGRRTTIKVLTTPAAPEQGVMAGVRASLAAAGLGPGDVAIVIHGTTLATNAIIERKGAVTALVTTQGFRDVLAMGNESRYDQYDLNITLPEPLVPRHLRLVVAERLDNTGRVLLKLDEAGVRALVPVLQREAVQSVAVGFLHSFVNGAHERRAREILEAGLPGVAVSISSEVSPEMREWERFSTTVANAAVGPVIENYLGRLRTRLEEAGYRGELLVILSHGGVASVAEATRLAAGTALSGPAGGVVGAAETALPLLDAAAEAVADACAPQYAYLAAHRLRS